MEYRIKRVQKQLDDLGYRQVLIPEALPLIEKLTADLIQTTESLQKYKQIAKDAIEERDSLQLGAEPYKCDNAKLVKECNDLHLAFLQFREQNEKLQKDLKRKLSYCEKEKLDCSLENERLKKRIRDLEYESAKKTDRLLASKSSVSGTKAVSKSTVTTNLRCKDSKSNVELNTKTYEQKIADLKKDVKRLEDEQLQLLEENDGYKLQVKNRDKEIERLTKMLEGGRPLAALNKDSCDPNKIINQLHSQIDHLQKEKSDLQICLKDAVSKQHEAMKRALALADRNKQLENELRDIDQMALEVEADCNSAAKTTADKIARLEDRIHELQLQVQSNDREIMEVKRDKQDLMSDLDALKVEKKHLQSILETALDEKKRLGEKISQLNIIENDLNLEIDRLVQTSAIQKRKIAELECQLLTGKMEAVTDRSTICDGKGVDNQRKGSPKKCKKKKETSAAKFNKSSENKPIELNQNQLNYAKFKANPPCTFKNFNWNLSAPDNTPRNSVDMFSTDKRLKSERDFYMKECMRISEKANGTTRYNKPSSLLQCCPEKDNLIATLQHENKTLAHEKHNLMTRLESVRDSLEDGNFDGGCAKATLRKAERERDMLKSDVFRLEEERDALRQRLNAVMELQTSERCKMEKALAESDNEIRRLELERHDLIQSQGCKGGTIRHLEERCEVLNRELKNAQTDVNQYKASYNQLKNLQEQTDTALADAQSQITQLELRLSKPKSPCSECASNKKAEDSARLKDEVSCFKQKLIQIDKEKDCLLISLDVKTERIASLEHEMRCKEKDLCLAEEANAELKRKMKKISDDLSEKDMLLRTSNSDLCSLRAELESAKRAVDNALQENRRLQDTLATTTASNRCAGSEIEQHKRQIEDLKRQLQTYVAEVKRFEDLINQKEMERNQLLDQFKSLSEEASALECNNHSLENEASQSKVQLSVTLDHVNDLEAKLNSEKQLVSDYEEQIADLRQQLYKMEERVKFYRQQQEQMNTELCCVKDLCTKLDKQKDNLCRELQVKDEEQMKISQDMMRFKRESEALQSSLSRDRVSLENLEKLLADAREEAASQRVYNEELENEIKTLNEKIEEFQNKLCGAATAVATFTYTTDVPNYDNTCTCCKSCLCNAQRTPEVVTSCLKQLNCACCGKLPKLSISERAENVVKVFGKKTAETFGKSCSVQQKSNVETGTVICVKQLQDNLCCNGGLGTNAKTDKSRTSICVDHQKSSQIHANLSVRTTSPKSLNFCGDSERRCGGTSIR
ncbi:hypothetical protein FQR65_LT00599 [Abscondita terminalis]|nr:hypothetical protein FQR65_LT00599 [Abscondita terminalis]